MDEDEKRPFLRYLRHSLVEFLGDLIFVYIGTLQGLSGAGVLGAALAHGLTIACLIIAMGHISGGHFNPAVTTGILVARRIHPVEAGFYVVAQLLGGFVGSLLARASVSGKVFADDLNAGVTSPPATMNVGPAQGILTETMMAFFLVTVVLCSAVDTDLNALAPLAIGLSITADILAGGGITGASINPARTLGPALTGLMWNANSPFHMHYIYWAGPIVGGALAGLIYSAILAKDSKRWLF